MLQTRFEKCELNFMFQVLSFSQISGLQRQSPASASDTLKIGGNAEPSVLPIAVDAFRQGEAARGAALRCRRAERSGSFLVQLEP